MKVLPRADFQLFEAHRLDKRAHLCRLLRKIEGGFRPVLELLRTPGAVARKTDYKCNWFAHVCVELEMMEKSLR